MTAPHLDIAIAQLNMTVGALAANQDKLVHTAAQAQVQQADIVITPELSICGYPPEDLLLRRSFVEACMASVRQLAQRTAPLPAMLVGTPWNYRDRVYNAAVLIEGGRLKSATFKKRLPNYGVFDEARVFTPGGWPKPLPFRGVRLGVQLCEDVWTPPVSKVLRERGAQVLIVMNASPFEQGKLDKRLNVCAARARETQLALVYGNMTGGQDELVFDGRSFLLYPNGQPAAYLPGWQESLRTFRWQVPSRGMV